MCMPSLTIRPTFVPTAERLPTKPGKYLCLARCGDIFTLEFNITHNMFNVTDNDTSTAITPLAWAKMPPLLILFARELRGDDD